MRLRRLNLGICRCRFASPPPRHQSFGAVRGSRGVSALCAPASPAGGREFGESPRAAPHHDIDQAGINSLNQSLPRASTLL